MTAPLPLTALQLDCARVIAEFAATTGRSPTYRELAREIDCCLSNVARLIDHLDAKGWLVPRRPGTAYALVLRHRPLMPDFAAAYTVTAAGVSLLLGCTPPLDGRTRRDQL